MDFDKKQVKASPYTFQHNSNSAILLYHRLLSPDKSHRPDRQQRGGSPGI
ncbi:MAG: hypothetical protein ACRC8Y_03070 [Chroococcales cyanobacterium]